MSVERNKDSDQNERIKHVSGDIKMTKIPR